MPVISTLSAVPDDVLITGIHCINIECTFSHGDKKTAFSFGGTMNANNRQNIVPPKEHAVGTAVILFSCGQSEFAYLHTALSARYHSHRLTIGGNEVCWR